LNFLYQVKPVRDDDETQSTPKVQKGVVAFRLLSQEYSIIYAEVNIRRSQPKRAATRRPAPKPQPSAFDTESDKAMAELQLKTEAHVAVFHMDTAE
jgi:hypothetical protein